MRVQVRVFGGLKGRVRREALDENATVQLAEGLTVRDLLQSLGLAERLGEGHILAVVNDEASALHRPLREGDTVTLFPPLAGGGIL